MFEDGRRFNVRFPSDLSIEVSGCSSLEAYEFIRSIKELHDEGRNDQTKVDEIARDARTELDQMDKVITKETT